MIIFVIFEPPFIGETWKVSLMELTETKYSAPFIQDISDHHTAP